MIDIFSLKQLALSDFSEVVNVRRYLHSFPELSGKEKKTAEFICKCLDTLQIPYQKDIAGNGIVAILSGTAKSGNDRTIALRADMDALPIQELSGETYCSQNDGVMHACGHDVHIASVLGTLMVLSKCKDSFSGRVKAIFQPSEEEYEGGAPFLIEAGVLENPKVDAIFGLHVTPELQSGTIGLHGGEFMASTDEIHLTICGKGGHAALVKETVNPIMIAAKILQTIEERVNIKKPDEVDMVLSFGRFIAEGSTNIIPEKAIVAGTFRTFSEDWRKLVLTMIPTIAEEIAVEMGGTCSVNIKNGYPVLVNNKDVTERVSDYAGEILGKDHVIAIPKRMTAEDFAYYLQEVPGVFLRLGTQSADGRYAAPLHSAKFDIDERAMQTAVTLLSWLTLRELA